MTKNLLKMSLLTLAGFALTNCGNPNQNVNGTTSGYYLNGGQCYQASNQQVVAQQYCTNTGIGTNGYVLQGNQCIQTSTGQAAPLQYCQGGMGTSGYILQGNQCIQSSTGQAAPLQYCQGGGYGGMGGMGPCYGNYYNPQNGRTGQCYGMNCSGYTLVNLSTGQQQYCQ